MSVLFRALPSVDVCLHHIFDAEPALLSQPRGLVRDAINAFLELLRQDIRKGAITQASQLEFENLSSTFCHFVHEQVRLHFRKVLNGTGVVIHTNMGRSVLAPEAIEAITAACSGYSNLELDLQTGERGSRYSHVVSLLCRLTGAEDALVVNNNAAAVLIVLDALCKGGEVIVARGQLVEIGGAFRIPEVMERGGVVLREVGCTNRVHLPDYAKAINENTRALMRIHTSNYRVIGFHSDVPVDVLASLAKERSIPLIEDLGSGSLVDLNIQGISHEPTVQSVVKAGADIVTFSGDKVLGGPQAGIIVGKHTYIEAIKQNPLLRALRIDKMTLAALEATLRLYVDLEQAITRVPTLRMICIPPADLEESAKRLARRLRKALGDSAKVACVKGMSRVGGGAFPEYDLPTTLVSIRAQTCTADTLRACLLRTDPPLLVRVEDDAVCLDVRTLPDAENALVAAALCEALDSSK